MREPDRSHRRERRWRPNSFSLIRLLILHLHLHLHLHSLYLAALFPPTHSITLSHFIVGVRPGSTSPRSRSGDLAPISTSAGQLPITLGLATACLAYSPVAPGTYYMPRTRDYPGSRMLRVRPAHTKKLLPQT